MPNRIDASQRHHDYYEKLATDGTLADADRAQWEHAQRKQSNVVRMFENRLEPREIPRKLDPRSTAEIIETLLHEVDE